METSIIFIYVVLGLMILAFVIEGVSYMVVWTGILSNSRRDKKGKEKDAYNRDSISVVVYSQNNSEDLDAFLPLILEQEYDDFEVVVVEDGSWDETEKVINRWKEIHPNLYLTRVPKETRVISRKKLALTIGAKAAKNDILVFTDAECRPNSMHWLDEIARKFTSKTEFVIGHVAIREDGSVLRHWIAYDWLVRSISVLGFASIGLPYSGFGGNLAYRRETFFSNKGYAGFFHKETGEDELMVNAYGTYRNTRIASSIESHTIDSYELTRKEWRYIKMQEIDNRREFTRASRIWSAIEPTAKTLFLLAVLAETVLFAIFWPKQILNILLLTCVLVILRLTMQLVIVNLTAAHYKQRRFGIELVLFDCFHPIAMLFWILSSIRNRHKRSRMV